MIFSLLSILGISYVIYKYYYDKQFLQIKYQKWLSLNEMVSSKYKSSIMIKIMSVYMIYKYYYIYFIQYLSNNVKKVEKNVYEITYAINGKVYKMRVKPLRGPSVYEKVLNDKNENVTEEVLSYFGPHFKNLVKLSPKNFNTTKLSFYRINGENIGFENNDEIEI